MKITFIGALNAIVGECDAEHRDLCDVDKIDRIARAVLTAMYNGQHSIDSSFIYALQGEAPQGDAPQDETPQGEAPQGE